MYLVVFLLLGGTSSILRTFWAEPVKKNTLYVNDEYTTGPPVKWSLNSKLHLTNSKRPCAVVFWTHFFLFVLIQLVLSTSLVAGWL